MDPSGSWNQAYILASVVGIGGKTALRRVPSEVIEVEGSGVGTRSQDSLHFSPTQPPKVSPLRYAAVEKLSVENIN